ncbi:uncharacterized protein [Salvelinus sp. IW2-2015]|uniref:uncharacterized protein n=1 Tax=Salvelinus sp. IW2-2015 TaxID=2691554 RepID=UPI0038D4D69B
MVQTHQDSREEGTTKPIPLRKLKRFGMGPEILKRFYSCNIESILTGCITAWYGNCSASDRKALQRVVRTAQHITGAKLPAIQDLYTRRCQRKALKIVNDPSHPSHRLFSLLPHCKQYRSCKSRTKRLLNSFYPQAIRLLNRPYQSTPPHKTACCTCSRDVQFAAGHGGPHRHNADMPSLGQELIYAAMCYQWGSGNDLTSSLTSCMLTTGRRWGEQN